MPKAVQIFSRDARWKETVTHDLMQLGRDIHPKELIAKISEQLLDDFAQVALLDKYDIYEVLMEYWAETMQDDVYAVCYDGYEAGREIAYEYVTKKKRENGQTIEVKTDKIKGFEGKQGDVDWLVSQFQYTSVNELELLATVDMAICDLRREGKEISVASIKDLIRSNKEWRDKLKKTYFRDSDIQQAIKKCEDLFES